MFVIPHQNLKKTLWKNGLGLTTPVLSSPQDSFMTDFDWRISFAEMNADTKFSEFPGYDRVLTVIDGGPLLINNCKYDLFTPFYFPGELKVDGILADQPLTDFGVIWKRGLFDVELQLIGASRSEAASGFRQILESEYSDETVLIFVVKGTVDVKCGSSEIPDFEAQLSRYDSFVFDPARDGVQIAAPPGSLAVQVAIKRLTV